MIKHSDIGFRRIREDDLFFVNQIRNQASKFLHDDRSFSLNETIQWFKDAHPNWFVIEVKGEDRIVGYFRLSHHDTQEKTIYIGCDLDERYRGKGIAYLAYIKFISFLFTSWDVNRILLEVLESNTIAYNLYRKLGFTESTRKPHKSEYSISMYLTLNNYIEFLINNKHK